MDYETIYHAPIKSRLQRLEDLETEDKVASYLMEEGIRGVRQHSERCPIAVYLGKDLDVRVDVDEGGCFWAGDKGLKLPPNVTGFVSMFDEGAYPELERLEE